MCPWISFFGYSVLVCAQSLNHGSEHESVGPPQHTEWCLRKSDVFATSLKKSEMLHFFNTFLHSNDLDIGVGGGGGAGVIKTDKL